MRGLKLNIEIYKKTILKSFLKNYNATNSEITREATLYILLFSYQGQSGLLYLFIVIFSSSSNFGIYDTWMLLP